MACLDRIALVPYSFALVTSCGGKVSMTGSQAKCSRELSPNPFGQALLWEAFFVDGLGLAMQYSADITGFYWFTGRLASVCGWCQVLSHVVLQTGDRSGCLPILLSAWDRNLEPRRLKR